MARAVVAAEGLWLTDGDGHRVLDGHGNGCHHIGYRHPRLVDALTRQLATLPFAPRRFTNAPAVALAERNDLARFEQVPVPGHTLTGRDLAGALSRVTGHADRKRAARNPGALRNNRIGLVLLRSRR